MTKNLFQACGNPKDILAYTLSDIFLHDFNGLRTLHMYFNAKIEDYVLQAKMNKLK